MASSTTLPENQPTRAEPARGYEQAPAMTITGAVTLEVAELRFELGQGFTAYSFDSLEMAELCEGLALPHGDDVCGPLGPNTGELNQALGPGGADVDTRLGQHRCGRHSWSRRERRIDGALLGDGVEPLRIDRTGGWRIGVVGGVSNGPVVAAASSHGQQQDRSAVHCVFHRSPLDGGGSFHALFPPKSLRNCRASSRKLVTR